MKGALRQGLKGRLARLRRLGIHSILTTSDPPLVAAAMAAEEVGMLRPNFQAMLKKQGIRVRSRVGD